MLTECVLVEAQKGKDSVKAEMVRHGDCSHHHQGLRRDDVDCFRLAVPFESPVDEVLTSLEDRLKLWPCGEVERWSPIW